MDDTRIVFTKLPDHINEMVSKGSDNFFTIYINPNQSQEGIERSYMHALQHIKKGDFEKNDVQAIEADAHGREDG